MLSVALTGGIGSGKSLAGEIFAELGALVIDSDDLARQVIERGSPGYDEVVARFGDEILFEGEIDRAQLAALIFEDPASRRDLEGIIHPRIREAAAALAARAGEGAIVINQIPLLFETNGANRFDLVVTVEADIEIRTERLLARGMKSYEITKRMAAQASQAERISIADFVIYNNGSREDLERAVTDLWERELLPRASK
jgi:dephospho-CoA kinase